MSDNKTYEYKCRTYLYLKVSKEMSIDEANEKMKDILTEVCVNNPGFDFLSSFGCEEIEEQD